MTPGEICLFAARGARFIDLTSGIGHLKIYSAGTGSSSGERKRHYGLGLFLAPSFRGLGMEVPRGFVSVVALMYMDRQPSFMGRAASLDRTVGADAPTNRILSEDTASFLPFKVAVFQCPALAPQR